MKEDEILLEDEDLEEEDTQKNRFLTFRLGKEEYGIEIIYVTEIVGLQNITKVPDMPNYVKGVINLRGKVIPVIDVRLRFKLESIDYDDRTCIIVVDIKNSTVGLIVDEVSEVVDIPENQMDPPPKTSKGSQSRYIQGIGKVGDNIKIILNVDKFLNDEELVTVGEMG